MANFSKQVRTTQSDSLCSRQTSLRDIEIAQSEPANALDSVDLQHMEGWLAKQYQRLAAKAEATASTPQLLVR